ncbi:hypothetical protein I4U23_018465 [Adineta vaga]|nr:hypothetical protein I4U23_018465 [Adineta vaga]
MFCGGLVHQWTSQKGKCSICGEAYDAKPTLFGKGDAMYLGKIVRRYTQGSFIPVTVVLTANHRGSFEFRLCNIDNNNNQDATQSCLDLNLLYIVNGSTKYYVESKFTTIHVNVSLPANVTCKHCVFQWKYVTGNSWGQHNGRSCLGCGNQNEEFYGCSDIAIHDELENIIEPTINTTKAIDTPRKCATAMSFSRSFDLTGLMGQYCERICSNDCAIEKEKNNTELHSRCVQSCNKLCICQ